MYFITSVVVTIPSLNESDTRYFSEHKKIMSDLDEFANSFANLKHDLFEFIEKAL